MDPCEDFVNEEVLQGCRLCRREKNVLSSPLYDYLTMTRGEKSSRSSGFCRLLVCRGFSDSVASLDRNGIHSVQPQTESP